MGSFLDYQEEPPPSGLRGCLTGFALLVAAAVACGFTLLASVEISCAHEGQRWLVDYPGATLVSHRQDSLLPFGLGLTVRILHTTDPEQTVRLWYNRHDTDISRQGVSPSPRQIQMFWRVAADPGTGGTCITLSARCGANM